MKTILFGGSFDPIHNGHIQLLQAFEEVIQPDRIVLMPAYVSPFKQGRTVTDASHRLAMCRLAFRERSDVIVSDWELRRQGASYTYQTLEMLAESVGNGTIYLITGADMFLSIDRWRCPSVIFRHAVIGSIPRNQDDIRILQQKADYLHAVGARTLLLDTAVMTVSSTEIRQKLRTGDSIASLVPESVAQYIHTHRLYQELTDDNGIL